MKRYLFPVLLLVALAAPVLAQPGNLCIFSDPAGLDCNFDDSVPALINFYVFHTETGGGSAVEFAAPLPACMTGATWLGDTAPFPVTIGNSQDGISIAYSGCLVGPIHVLTISVFGAGLTSADCAYPVLANPQSGDLAMVDCGLTKVPLAGGTAYINSTLPCECPSGPLPPILHVLPGNLNFGTALTSLDFDIINLGGGTLDWSASPSDSWISVNPTMGSGNATLTVTIDRTGLPGGDYSGEVAVTSNGGNETVTVNMTVQLPTPILGFFPPSLSYPPDLSQLPLSITNEGTGTLSWSITPSEPWLSANPSSGTDDQLVLVDVDRTGLADGNYAANLAITSNGGNGSVPVMISVASGPILVVDPTLLIFNQFSSPKQFDISNAGIGTLDWSLTPDQPWIVVDPPLNGSGPASPSVHVDVNTVPAGNQTGHIQVTSNGGNASVEVRYNPVATSPGALVLAADPYGLECNISDHVTGLLSIYVVHSYTNGVAGSGFSAPMPPCMTGVTYLADYYQVPINIGNSQTGVQLSYGGCLASPIHVLTMQFFATATSQTCCWYDILPHPLTGRIEAYDCANNIRDASTSPALVNSDFVSCFCGLIKNKTSSWGHIKALYAPEKE